MSGKTVAVVGASANRTKFGNKAVRAFRDAGWTVFPIHPTLAASRGLAGLSRPRRPARRRARPGQLLRAAAHRRRTCSSKSQRKSPRRSLAESRLGITRDSRPRRGARPQRDPGLQHPGRRPHPAATDGPNQLSIRQIFVRRSSRAPSRPGKSRMTPVFSSRLTRIATSPVFCNNRHIEQIRSNRHDHAGCDPSSHASRVF